MATTNLRTTVLVLLFVALFLGAAYLIDPSMYGLLKSRESFTDAPSTGQTPGVTDMPGNVVKEANEKKASGFIGSMLSGFDDASGSKLLGMADASGAHQGFEDKEEEGFANLDEVSGPAAFGGANAPAGCYPHDQLTPAELLPKDGNSTWAQQNPMGTGSLKGKNFLSAGALIGVNTVGQTLRNANYQLRSEPPNPQVSVSVFNNSTIEPDTNRRDLEIN